MSFPEIWWPLRRLFEAWLFPSVRGGGGTCVVVGLGARVGSGSDRARFGAGPNIGGASRTITQEHDPNYRAVNWLGGSG